MLVTSIPLWEGHKFDLPLEWELRKNADFVILRDSTHDLHVALPIHAEKQVKFNKANLSAARQSLAQAVFLREYGQEALLELTRARRTATKTGQELGEKQAKRFARLNYLTGETLP